MPRSYRADAAYWRRQAYMGKGNHPSPLDSPESIQDRVYATTCLNLYDGATWQIALALENLFEPAEMYQRQVLFQSSTNGGAELPAEGGPGGLASIRGETDDFVYGCDAKPGSSLDQVEYPCPHWNQTFCLSDQYVPVKRPGASMFRLIGTHFRVADPFLGDIAVSYKVPPKPEPTWNKWGAIIWDDWKPITGENVWANMIGPLQVLFLKGNGTLPKVTGWKDVPAEVKIGISIMPAMEALASPLGSLYHCPKGSKLFPEDEDEATNVSNENNVSAYAALRMFAYVLQGLIKNSDASIPELDAALQSAQKLLDGLDSWMEKYAFVQLESGYKVVLQGGHVTCDGTFKPAVIEGKGGDPLNFAVDCQTWSVAAMGPDKLDKIGGDGTVYGMWQAVKQRSAYLQPDGSLGGVGYTGNGTRHDIWSAEWTYGAITMLREAAEYYNSAHPDWSANLQADAQAMMLAMERNYQNGGMETDDGAMLYANKRFFIPWGWYANQVASTCSTAWRIMNRYNFNPFVLGGGLYPLP